jgi:uncharacterized membrane protein YeaQ/YmgE (transglycosylase-associated protein family)
MNILVWVTVGAAIGWIFVLTAVRNRQRALAAYVLLGVLGSIGAAALSSKLGGPGITWFDVSPILIAFAGALFAVAVGHWVMHYAVVRKEE